MANEYYLYYINISSQNAICLSEMSTTNEEKVFGLISSIAQMGQNVGSSSIVNIELEKERIFIYNSPSNTDNLLLLSVSINTDKEKVMAIFKRYVKNFYNKQFNAFEEALSGSDDALKKAQQLTSKYFNKLGAQKNAIKWPFIFNVLIGLITSFAIIELVIVLPKLLSEEVYLWFGNISSTFSALTAFVFIAIVSYKYGLKSESGKIWMLLGISFFLMMSAECTWGILDIFIQQDPYPSIADFLWISSYVIMLVALILEDRAIKIPRNILFTIIWSIVLLGTGIAIYFTLAHDIFTYEDYGFLEKAVSVFYVYWDLILLFVLGLIFVKYKQGKIGVSWLFIMIGITITAVADILYSYAEWNEFYNLWKHYIDPIFVIGYYGITIAAILHLKTLKEEELNVE